MTTMIEKPLFEFVLGLADDQLILGHRLSEWTGRAPVLEEELALPNIALDLIGAARSLYQYAGVIEASGRDEDQLAYLREASQYRNLLLAELPNGDFALTMARLVLYATFMTPYWEALSGSSDTTLSAIAARCVKESRYHVRHASQWLIRLGDGTAESQARAQTAIDELWPFTGELFEMAPAERSLIAAGIAIERSGLEPGWDRAIATVLAEATLAKPRDGWMQSGGRLGRHTEHLGHLLAELQHLQRAYPGATW